MSQEEQLKNWVQCWQKADSTLKQLRRESLHTVNPADVIESLSDAFESARIHNPIPLTSGLVEQQRHFQRLRSWNHFLHSLQGLGWCRDNCRATEESAWLALHQKAVAPTLWNQGTPRLAEKADQAGRRISMKATVCKDEVAAYLLCFCNFCVFCG